MNKTFTISGALLVLMTFFFQLQPARLQAQTTLAVGDLMFTGFNTMPNAGVGDTFSFVLLKAVDSGTKISFSDRGFLNGTWFTPGSTEASVTWTAGSGVTMGTEVMIYGVTSRRYDPVSTTLIPCGTVAVTEGTPVNGLTLPTAGDQVFAFQGGNGSITGTGVVLIAGIHTFWCNSSTTFSSWDGGACATSQSASSMPLGLSATGTTASAFYTGRATATTDPAWGKFNAPTPMPTTPEALRAAIMTQSNWTLGNTSSPAPFALPSRFSYSSTPLPVHLLNFNVSNKDRVNQLDWTSTQETAGDKFVVERSQDGSNFNVLSEVTALTAHGKNAYQYIDQQPFPGTNYYRLHLVNVDGSSEYSKVVSVRLQEDAAAGNFRVYPNPFTNEFSLEVLTAMGSDAKVKVTDITGREVAKYQMNGPTLTVSLPQFAAGVYYIEYRDSNTSKNWKVVKQ